MAIFSKNREDMRRKEKAKQEEEKRKADDQMKSLLHPYQLENLEKVETVSVNWRVKDLKERKSGLQYRLIDAFKMRRKMMKTFPIGDRRKNKIAMNFPNVTHFSKSLRRVKEELIKEEAKS